jgi:putative two-component system response regulator
MTKILVGLSSVDYEVIVRFSPSSEVIHADTRSKLCIFLEQENDISLLIASPSYLLTDAKTLVYEIRKERIDVPILLVLDGKTPDDMEYLADVEPVDLLHRPLDQGARLTEFGVFLSLGPLGPKLRECCSSGIEWRNKDLFCRMFPYDGTVDVIMNLFGSDNKNLAAHLSRTATMMRILASQVASLGIQGYEISSSELEDMVRGAPFHDIGKICIPLPILNKPGKLTADEFEVIKHHVVCGAGIVRFLPAESIYARRALTIARRIILGHYERYDGKGYPYGLKKGSIPLGGRLMAIIDVYDALTSERPYKHALPHEEAVEIIKEERGTHFDPIVTDAFLDTQNKIQKISEHYKPFEVDDLFY